MTYEILDIMAENQISTNSDILNQRIACFADITRISKLWTTCHSPWSAQLYNAYASLQYFASTQIGDCVPEDGNWRDQKFVGCADAI